MNTQLVPPNRYARILALSFATCLLLSFLELLPSISTQHGRLFPDFPLCNSGSQFLAKVFSPPQKTDSQSALLGKLSTLLLFVIPSGNFCSSFSPSSDTRSLHNKPPPDHEETSRLTACSGIILSMAGNNVFPSSSYYPTMY